MCCGEQIRQWGTETIVMLMRSYSARYSASILSPAVKPQVLFEKQDVMKLANFAKSAIDTVFFAPGRGVILPVVARRRRTSG